MKKSIHLLFVLLLIARSASSQDSLLTEKPKKNFFQVAFIYSPTITVGQNPYGEGSTFETELTHSYGVKFSYSKREKFFVDGCLSSKKYKFNSYLIDNSYSMVGLTGYSKVTTQLDYIQGAIGLHSNFFKGKTKLITGFYVSANMLVDDEVSFQYKGDPSKNNHYNFKSEYANKGNSAKDFSGKVYVGVFYRINSRLSISITPYLEYHKHNIEIYQYEDYLNIYDYPGSSLDSFTYKLLSTGADFSIILSFKKSNLE